MKVINGNEDEVLFYDEKRILLSEILENRI